MAPINFTYKNCDIKLIVNSFSKNKFTLEIILSCFSGGDVTDTKYISKRDFNSEQEAINYGKCWAIKKINSDF